MRRFIINITCLQVVVFVWSVTKTVTEQPLSLPLLNSPIITVTEQPYHYRYWTAISLPLLNSPIITATEQPYHYRYWTALSLLLLNSHIIRTIEKMRHIYTFVFKQEIFLIFLNLSKSFFKKIRMLRFMTQKKFIRNSKWTCNTTGEKILELKDKIPFPSSWRRTRKVTLPLEPAFCMRVMTRLWEASTTFVPSTARMTSPFLNRPSFWASPFATIVSMATYAQKKKKNESWLLRLINSK